MSYAKTARPSACADLPSARRLGQHYSQRSSLLHDARTAARALGGEASGNCIIAPGPRHSPRDRSLSVKLDPDASEGFLAHSFAGDDPLACRDHVRAALGLQAFDGRRRVQPRPKPAPIPFDTADNEKAALAICRQCLDLRGTLAEQYLRHRGLTLDLGAFADLRFHAALRFESSTTPGMVALMRDVRTNEPCGIHRTFLDREGRKLDRRMLGRAKGACVIVQPDVWTFRGGVITHPGIPT